jgi:pyruvate formate lyase activating enzyme
VISAADSFIVDVKDQEGLDADEYELFIETAVSLEKPIKLTNVIVPTVNDTEERLTEIKRLAAKIPESLFKGIKFLPFRKLCVGKYEKLGLEFPYASYREGERDDIALAMEIYKNI